MPSNLVEIMIKGEPDMIKGFVIGFLEGRGNQGDTFIEEKCILEEDSPLSMVIHFFSGRPHIIPVIADSGMRESLCQALQRRKEDVPSEIVSIREVMGASFDFHYKTFSRELGKTLNDFFSNLPSGIQFKGDYKHEEKIDLEGKGIEAYAPLHDYEIKGSGVVQGGAKEIYKFYCRSGQFEVVELGKLKLQYGNTIRD